MGKEFGTEMYDQKYTTKNESKPRAVVSFFVDNYLTAGQNCLDLGIGAGRHSQYLAEKGIKVTAVDISPVGVEKTKEKLSDNPESGVAIADIHHLPFANESFDSLISNRVLDYNNEQGLEEVFAEIARVTRNRSLVLITVRSVSQPPKGNEVLVEENNAGGKTFQVQEGSEQNAFQHYFAEQEIKDLAERHGFEIKEIREQTKTNSEEELKSEWQVIMMKIKN
ncbi:MAG: class I SAM-dependent methyltransferase [Candidatus Vogelbacteria bacterium]|nr:class I SAM-dependent methyltransferase [Candidatus Vogelbacteria bacterium]